VIDFPDSATFAAALADRRILTAAAVSALAGLVRGFSGFGGAMIYMPLIAAIYEPRIAAVTLLLVDFASARCLHPQLRCTAWSPVDRHGVAVPPEPCADRARPDRLRWGIALVLSLIRCWPGLALSRPLPPVTIGVGLVAGTAPALRRSGPR
jgi:hypothetical protein